MKEMGVKELLVGDTASKELMLATLDRLVEGKVVARRAVNAIRKLIEDNDMMKREHGKVDCLYPEDEEEK